MAKELEFYRAILMPMGKNDKKFKHMLIVYLCSSILCRKTVTVVYVKEDKPLYILCLIKYYLILLLRGERGPNSGILQTEPKIFVKILFLS